MFGQANQHCWAIQSHGLLWFFPSTHSGLKARTWTGTSGEVGGGRNKHSLSTDPLCVCLSPFMSISKSIRPLFKVRLICLFFNLSKSPNLTTERSLKSCIEQTGLCELPKTPAVTWLSVKHLYCWLKGGVGVGGVGSTGRFRCCNQTPSRSPPTGSLQHSNSALIGLTHGSQEPCLPA